MNSSGKVLTIFAVIISILLMTLTAASFYYLKNEIELRKYTEMIRDKALSSVKQLEGDIKGTKNITKKDKIEDKSLEEWLLKKIKTKGQKNLKELLGQKVDISK